eukprot:TRINITY_DN10217_c0_g1_i1.p1 TRINITY_DN10217_c0_g1~~TRINITY_DN10217_c0_g1_i1.p1  ORF type:complete len:681 (+),score=89.87 TRINITY_DN10217_c0_g1_i1:154-2196(+)
MAKPRQASVIEIDQTNFIQAKPVVANAVKNAMFVAFDCEFTGLHREKQQGTNVVMSAKTRYSYLRQTMFGGGFTSGRCLHCGTEQLESANFCHQCGVKRKPEDKQGDCSQQGIRRQEYLIAQIGLACYIWSEQKKIFEVKCFSFYISPRPWAGSMGMGNVKVENDLKFSCMGSSLKFLGDHSFDFNRWINDGIPFMSRTQYNGEREKIQQRGQYSTMKDLEHGRGFLDIWDILLTSGKPLVGHQCFLDILYLWHQLEGPLHRDLPEVMRELSSKVRVIVDTKHLLTWYPQEICTVLEREELNLRQRMLSRLKADLASKEKKKKELEETGKEEKSAKEKLLEERSGLLRRQSEMQDAIKHNVCKELQKNISASEDVGNKFRNMQLNEIYKVVFPLIQDMVPHFASKEHDAGYDAYITGAIFLGLFTLLHPENVLPTGSFLLDTHTASSRKTASIFTFVNRIYMFAAPYFISTSAVTLPPLEETHCITFLVEPGPGGHIIDAGRLRGDIRKADPFSELYWIEYQKKGVVVCSRQDIAPSEVHKKLVEVLAPVQVSCVAKRAKVPGVKTSVQSPSSGGGSSPKKAVNAASMLTQLNSKLSQLTASKRKAAQAASLAKAASPKRKPKSPATRPQPPPVKTQIPLEDVLSPPPEPKRRSLKRPPSTPPLEPKKPKRRVSSSTPAE